MAGTPEGFALAVYDVRALRRGILAEADTIGDRVRDVRASRVASADFGSVARDGTGAVPVKRATLRRASIRAAQQTGGWSAAAGLLGGMPLFGAVGGAEGMRHSVDVPLAGLDLTDTAVDAGFVLGGAGDPAVYNDAILEETEAARKRAESIPVAGSDDRDLW